jgi:hypothetical protein
MLFFRLHGDKSKPRRTYYGKRSQKRHDIGGHVAVMSIRICFEDLSSILENAIDDEDDTGEADPGAVAILANEAVPKTQEAAKEDESDESGDEDEDGDD